MSDSIVKIYIFFKNGYYVWDVECFWLPSSIFITWTIIDYESMMLNEVN